MACPCCFCGLLCNYLLALRLQTVVADSMAMMSSASPELARARLPAFLSSPQFYATQKPLEHQPLAESPCLCKARVLGIYCLPYLPTVGSDILFKRFALELLAAMLY
ncbi:hypothetical protein V8C26DRAFT_396904 [Trichoderma gracile]